MREVLFAQAIREAIMEEMEKDSRIYVAGEDVSWGGISGQYEGIRERYPDRIYDTPITETAIAGLGLGSAAMGLRPIIEFSLMDFTLVAMDEICNQIAKFRYMNGGTQKIPLVLHCYCRASIGSAAQHSQSLEALYAHIPGLKVLMPSNPADAKGLMTAAIRDDDPVIYIQHMKLMGERGDLPEGDHLVPIGKAAVMRPGKDLSIISYGGTIPCAVVAADMLARDGISAEVLDLRTLTPLDRDAILATVKKTGRVVIAHEAVKQGGLGAEVAAVIVEEAFGSLSAPIRRLGAPFCPTPFSPALKDAYLVSARDIYTEAKELLKPAL